MSGFMKCATQYPAIQPPTAHQLNCGGCPQLSRYHLQNDSAQRLFEK